MAEREGYDTGVYDNCIQAINEALRIDDVVGRSEQLVCSCGEQYNSVDLEPGICHKCWELIKEAN